MTINYSLDTINWELMNDRHIFVSRKKNYAINDLIPKIPRSIFNISNSRNATRWINTHIDEIEKGVNEKEYRKKQIEQLFEGNRTLYFSDISEQLDVDLKMVVGICKELLDEGKIHVKKNKSK